MRILVCPPDHFDVEYVINPWMHGQIGGVDPELARSQWENLFEDVSATARVETVLPRDGSPDMCFTANAGLVESNRVLPARFRMPERSSEESHFKAWFESEAFELSCDDESTSFEGEGDALFQPDEPLLWAGYGVRTALESHVALAATFEVEVVSLRLIDPRFYHLDTCFAPLPGQRILYYPEAFDARSQATIESRIPPERRIAVHDEDALNFACNTLRVGDRLFMNSASDTLRRKLANWSFEARVHPVSEFLKAGGGVKCLSLLLDQDHFERGSRELRSSIRTGQVAFRGHLLDQGLLRRALDAVTEASGSFRVETLDLAERKDQDSRILLRIAAPNQEIFDQIIERLSALGGHSNELE